MGLSWQQGPLSPGAIGPGRYPGAYFPNADISRDSLQRTEHTTRHPDLGPTSWYSVRAGDHSAARGAWHHVDLPTYASALQARVAFGIQLRLEPGQAVIPHGPDRNLTVDETLPHGKQP